ncbi:hypothetical protein [Arthrobacter sp. NyZ413]|uniref:hypothetical protein n=1 Tax=Arthrobacter sp. NyZ413 TaxID=3144669 RepID=UPI003BF7A62F
MPPAAAAPETALPASSPLPLPRLSLGRRFPKVLAERSGVDRAAARPAQALPLRVAVPKATEAQTAAHGAEPSKAPTAKPRARVLKPPAQIAPAVVVPAVREPAPAVREPARVVREPARVVREPARPQTAPQALPQSAAHPSTSPTNEPAQALTGTWPELAPHQAPRQSAEQDHAHLESTLARAARLSNERLAV